MQPPIIVGRGGVSKTPPFLFPHAGTVDSVYVSFDDG
ncbi:hypothetical protein RHAB21_02805 [Pseudorhizobium halotolerans]|uniref:Uncharacterized protein n=1 Tax=Pseudorhizobium halotolerans TaxID=1233081 RepID=A0ABM8PMX3_9HYPH|nr:hypothetical protein RHAB21_02805 [Pseudorhizobium halotolerans]